MIRRVAGAAGRLLSRADAQAPPPTTSLGSWDALADHDVVALCHPEWRGIRAATHAHEVAVVESAVPGAHADEIVDRLLDADVRALVVQGFPPGAGQLLRRAHVWGIGTRVVLHSSMTQHGGESWEATVADEVVALQKAGVVDRIGFVKEGQAEAFGALGHPAVWVPNRVPDLREVTPVRLDGVGPHIGVFVEPFWRKNPVPQLGAVALLGGHAHVLVRPDVAYLEGLPITAHGMLPWAEFTALQASVELNLYVTLSECYPMSPLESYATGVPCLLSRTSSIFRDDPELWQLSTVDELDNPRAIAHAAERLLAQREEAIARARDWMARWDAVARDRWAEFVAP